MIVAEQNTIWTLLYGKKNRVRGASNQNDKDETFVAAGPYLSWCVSVNKLDLIGFRLLLQRSNDYV